jgi:osomolarity two-component system, response regulator SKN7
MLNFQRTLSTQDSVMQNIIQYIVNPETNAVVSRDNTPFVPGEQAQKLISSYDEAAKASVDIMNDLSQLGASLAPNALSNQPLPPPMQHPSHIQESPQYASSTYSVKSDQVKSEYQTPTRETFASSATSPESTSNRPLHKPPPSQPLEDPSPNFTNFDNFQFPEQPSGDSQNTGGLRVFTVGHFAPRQDEDDSDTNTFPHAPSNLPIVKDHDDKHTNGLRVRRQTFVPGWAVPPKILLVDDDAVYRNMSSKFLQVFGCEADVAVDGFSALDKVNVEKYDLILMDVVMPNLDGISATNMIRQFDLATPIISMTSNIHSNDIMHYFNSGTPSYVGKADCRHE